MLRRLKYRRVARLSAPRCRTIGTVTRLYAIEQIAAFRISANDNVSYTNFKTDFDLRSDEITR